MEYTVEEARQIIKETTEKNLPYVFKGIFPIVPTWDQFINHLDYQSTKEPPYVSEPDKGYEAIYGIFKKHNFYLQVRDAVCTPLRAKQFFPEGVAVKRFFDSVYSESSGGAAAFINFTSSEPDTPSHQDDWDNVHWQCIGSTIWETRINKDDEDPYETFTLEPGDVIVVPMGSQHAVKRIGPRAGMVFTYKVKNIEYKDAIKEAL